MKISIFFVLFLLILGCSDKKQPILGDTEWQKEVNSNFKDASKSPLKEADLKNFKSLDFFDFDEKYIIEAKLIKLDTSSWFNMPTTTGRTSKERVYGILKFQLEGENFSLKVYQGEENLNTPGFEDYLFLPFLDDTNGGETYGGGRYIDLRIPEGDSIEIDFNKAYNPYCVYNEKFSCPLVPRENYLNIEVRAGMKMFKPSAY